MVKNILDDIVYIEPSTDGIVPDGMCKNNPKCNGFQSTDEIILNKEILDKE